MNLRTAARVLIAGSFLVSGLVETLGATGLVIELSPDGRWGSGIHTLAVSGPMQIAGAVLLASGRKTRLALIILGSYVLLACLFGNLPLVLTSSTGGSALAGLLGNLAVMGGIMHWFQSERFQPDALKESSVSIVGPKRASLAGLVLCLAVMGGAMYWLHSGRVPGTHRARPAVPATNHVPASPVKLLA